MKDLKFNKGSNSINLLLGIVFALGIVFVSFEWSSTEIRTIIQTEFGDDIFVDAEQVPITYAKEKSRAMPPLPRFNPLAFEPVEDVALDIPDEIPVFNETFNENINSSIVPNYTNNIEEIEEPLPIVQVMPRFPGGENALLAFLSQSINYPQLAIEYNITGRVFIEFVIEKDGSVSNAVVSKGVDESLNEEAIRVVNMMPKWKAGIQNGRNVRVKMTLPVNFVLR